MWIYSVLICLLPFVLLCADKRYENFTYEDLYEYQANSSAGTSFQFSANLNHQSPNQTLTDFSSNIFVESANNYQHQEKLLAYSIQQELIDRFLKTCTLEEFKA
jgi:hypothetical protein